MVSIADGSASHLQLLGIKGANLPQPRRDSNSEERTGMEMGSWISMKSSPCCGEASTLKMQKCWPCSMQLIGIMTTASILRNLLTTPTQETHQVVPCVTK